jgi:hypothetical protein
MASVSIWRAAFGICLWAAVASDAQARTGHDCKVSAADKARNATLAYEDFDQTGSTRASFRQLSTRRCEAAAAEVVEHYLINGPALDPKQRRNLIFHMGQSLAMAGREREGAWVILGALDSAPQEGGLDWNDYVIGTWAFLIKDRPRLEEQISRLTAKNTRGDQINASALGGLRACFKRSYSAAYQAACRPPPKPR